MVSFGYNARSTHYSGMHEALISVLKARQPLRETLLLSISTLKHFVAHNCEQEASNVRSRQVYLTLLFGLRGLQVNLKGSTNSRTVKREGLGLPVYRPHPPPGIAAAVAECQQPRY